MAVDTLNKPHSDQQYLTANTQLQNSAMGALLAEALAELRKVNDNLVGLCLAVRSNTGSQPSPNAPGFADMRNEHLPVESRTAMALEQLRRRPRVPKNEQGEPVHGVRPAQPGGESS